VPFGGGWVASAVTTVGRGVADQIFGRSSVWPPDCAGASSIDRSGAYDDRLRSQGELRARQELSRLKVNEKTEWEMRRHDGWRERYGTGN
jgi:hypothetical protein